MGYNIGDKVTMSEVALENYGYENQGKEFTVCHVATKYMPSKEFYSKDSPEDYHPGYDESVAPQKLYDFEELNYSLYDYELI